jgi:ABC-2 type transport system permease protein
VNGAARRVWLVARREWNQRVRTRSFVVATVISIAIVVAMILLPDALGAGGERTVGLVGDRSARLPSLIRAAGDDVGLTVRTEVFEAEAAARAALRADDVSVLLIDEHRLVWAAEADEQLGAVVTIAVQIVEREAAIDALSLTPEEAGRLLEPPPLDVTSLEPVTPERAERGELAMVGVAVLLMAIAFYGGFLVVGVVEEKSSRVVEVLLSRVRPPELFAGKILGIGLSGLSQLALIAIAALVALGSSTNPAAETTPGTVLAIVVWFILGYGLYAVLYGTVGSLISRQEEAESIQFPVTAVLLVAYFVSMEVARSPDGMAAIVGSFVPLTAPMVMTVRMAHGAAAAWEVLLSVTIVVATIAGLIALAGRVYAGAVLRIGRRVRVREAWRGAAS